MRRRWTRRRSGKWPQILAARCYARDAPSRRRTCWSAMPQHPIDESRAFVPVRIAVLTVSDTRDASNDTSGDTLAARIADAGHILADRVESSETIRAPSRLQLRALDRRSRDRCRDLDRRHGTDGPRRDRRSVQVRLRKRDRRLLRASSTRSASRRSARRHSSRAPARAWRMAPICSPCPARPAR